jgi:hypothetical protein
VNTNKQAKNTIRKFRFIVLYYGITLTADVVILLLSNPALSLTYTSKVAVSDDALELTNPTCGITMDRFH